MTLKCAVQTSPAHESVWIVFFDLSSIWGFVKCFREEVTCFCFVFSMSEQAGYNMVVDALSIYITFTVLFKSFGSEIHIYYIYIRIYIYISAVKRLIAINRIQNKSFCLHNIYVCTFYIYYVYLNTHTHKVYILKICIFIYMYIFIFI